MFIVNAMHSHLNSKIFCVKLSFKIFISRGSSMTFVSTQNWAQFDVAPVKEQKVEFDWNITVDQWSKYEEAFHSIRPLHGFISGTSNLKTRELAVVVWQGNKIFCVCTSRWRNARGQICMAT